MISPETIRNIIETARIEEVIGEFVTIKKRGVNYIGLCPFHNEKTPSFTISPSKGIYKCFGCGKAGNAVNFIMEHEHYSYPEAIKYLAKKYNIEIEEEEQTPEQIQALNEKESLYHVSTFAQKHFSDNLFNNDEGKAIGLSYLKERDFSEETIKKFQLGYSLDKWDKFTEYALNNGYKLDYLTKTGLTISKENKNYDRFRARVIFPIHNLSGRIIGFGGRILTSEKNKPKYINSPESDIYNKSKVLYGIYFAKNAIININNCYLVEGYTDVISLHQAGINNVVASSGTSLTTEQIRLIKRYTPNITILYDGDEAGIKASFRGIDMILEQSMNVKIVLFPEGEDPDSFARNHRTSEVNEFINNKARDFIEFKTNLLLKETADDPLKKASLIKEIVNTISLIPDSIYRSVYIKKCSSMLDIPEQTLMNELNKILRNKFKKKHQTTFEEIPESTEFTAEKQIDVEINESEYQEKDIIRLLLLYGTKEIIFEIENEDKHIDKVPVKVSQFIINDLKADNISFQNKLYQLIFNEFVSALEDDFIPDDQFFINHKDEKISKLSIDIISSKYELSKNWEEKKSIYTETEEQKLKETVITSLLALKAKKIDIIILENQKEISKAENDEEIVILLEKQKSLKNISKIINAQLGRIITK
ncbi:MAG: DNA primase [Bacteroidales bacterium]|nr:DNA primase [Bacteroidales bacterium]